MILTTGGRASGATSTRSSPRACAAAMASSIGSTPSCSPSFAITRTGLMRICLLTRIRWVLLFSITRAGLLLTSENETADPVSNSGSAKVVVGHRCPAPTTSAFGTLTRARPGGDGVRRSRRPLTLFVEAKLADANGVHKAEAFAVPPQPPGDHFRVVLEPQQPPLGLGPRIQPPLALQRHQRLQVVPHDPGQRQVGGRGHEVGQKARP